MDLSPISLSVVIMAYNEAENIGRQVRETLSFLDSSVSDGEVIAVDDGSTDETGKILDEIAAHDRRVRVLHHPSNLGMGMAIRSGYKAARLDFVTQLPGDGQVHPEVLRRFLPYLPDYDLVLSTYAKRDDGLLRFFVTRAYWAVALAILGHPCNFTGTMVIRRSLLDRLTIRSRTFMVNVEVPLKLMKLGIKPAFVTIEASARRHGRSKVLTPRGVAMVIREMLDLRLEIGRVGFWENREGKR